MEKVKYFSILKLALLGLETTVLATDIYSASPTCLVREDEKGMVWAPQQGLASF